MTPLAKKIEPTWGIVLSGAAFGAFASTLAFAVSYHWGTDENPHLARVGFGWINSSFLGCLYGIPFGAVTAFFYSLFETQDLDSRRAIMILIPTLALMIVGGFVDMGFITLVFGLLTFSVAVLIVRKK